MTWPRRGGTSGVKVASVTAVTLRVVAKPIRGQVVEQSLLATDYRDATGRA